MTDDPTGDPIADPAEGPTDDSAFGYFYRTNYRRVVLSLRLGSGAFDDADADGEAEDVAQEAFARTLVHWNRVGKGSNPLGYVYRVAFRLQRRRRFLRRRRHDAANAAARLERAGATDDGWSDAAAVRTALAELPPACARAAVLCLFVEMTAPEAAAVLGTSASTVRSHLQRARRVLATALGAEPGPHPGAMPPGEDEAGGRVPTSQRAPGRG